MNLTKGFQNIFTPTLTNLLISLSLVIIVILVYMKNKTIDLFNDNLQSIVDKYKAKKKKQN